jgi:hypothetical protein
MNAARSTLSPTSSSTGAACAPCGGRRLHPRMSGATCRYLDLRNPGWCGLDRLLIERGKPGTIVSDDGTESTSNAILQWADDHRVAWHYIAPGKAVEKPSRNRLSAACAANCSTRRCSARCRTCTLSLMFGAWTTTLSARIPGLAGRAPPPTLRHSDALRCVPPTAPLGEPPPPPPNKAYPTSDSNRCRKSSRQRHPRSADDDGKAS